ncbi:DUF4214 domain-containing protein [Cohnella sp. AR92]|uniref:DUF4214 domain-containing protein n=1 Tax=Cohnella sp. AR92 TaxID=648716 RepID=UPI000F8CF8EB|nr:DUF4214 domain-containing protein [Cohnella sp. AR92]RUS44227.1 DUF4214 domain-containing protein [Cohnella sp. AR92]
MTLGERFKKLLRLEGVLFIEEAYRQLLNRECNAVGLEHHLALLGQGKSKSAILIGMLMSEEAKSRLTPSGPNK